MDSPDLPDELPLSFDSEASACEQPGSRSPAPAPMLAPYDLPDELPLCDESDDGHGGAASAEAAPVLAIVVAAAHPDSQECTL